jgi:hypothetical protein
LPAHPIAIVLTSASAAMLAPNLCAVIPTHLLCPGACPGGLGKATSLVSQKGYARNQARDGRGKAIQRPPKLLPASELRRPSSSACSPRAVTADTVAGRPGAASATLAEASRILC